MRLFFIGWSGKDLGVVAAMKNLKQAGHEIVYCTCSNLEKEIDRADFPGTIFQGHLDAEEGVSAPVLRDEKFDPPGEALLRDLLEAESTVMTMMNKHFEGRGIAERKQLYFKYVSYWNGVLQKYRPDAIVFLATPHNNYDFVIYSLAKRAGIKTILMEAIWVNDRVVIMEDLEKGSSEFLKHQNQNFDLEFLSQDLKDFYRWQLDKEKDPTPFYVNDTWEKFSGLNLLRIKGRVFYKSVKDLSLFKKLYFFLKKRLGKNPIKEYRQVQSEPDFFKKFIYLPLHYQPERATSAQGGVFDDQILIVETLAASLPAGWQLYVKEHPVQWLYRGPAYFNCRFQGYYQMLASIKNVKLIPVNANSFALIKNCQAVATISGTPGWEALLRMKPVLLFGYPWYLHLKGIFKVSDVRSCQRAIEEIRGGFVLKKQDVINNLGAVEQSTFRGYTEEAGRKISAVTAKENSIAIAKAIAKNLSQ